MWEYDKDYTIVTDGAGFWIRPIFTYTLIGKDNSSFASFEDAKEFASSHTFIKS